MLIDVAEARAIGDHRLYLRFADGIVRWDGLFAPLRDPSCFAQVRVDPDLGTVVWPNGADLDPDVLYAVVTGQAVDLTTPSTPR